MKPKIKICGITQSREITYLIQNRVDYAGFVLFEKSKRAVTVDEAKCLKEKLACDISSVAVTVSPSIELVRQIEAAEFDILQVHKELSWEVLEEVNIPVWYAMNIAYTEEIEKQLTWINQLPETLKRKISGLVLDGAQYGSGKPFRWQKNSSLDRIKQMLDCEFILAGGLNEANVRIGIDLFKPDIVDVSTGVEDSQGKNLDKIEQFVGKVRN